MAPVQSLCADGDGNAALAQRRDARNFRRAQHVRGLRDDRSRRPDACASSLWRQKRPGGQRGRGDRRGGGAGHAVRHAAAFQEGHSDASSRACWWSRRSPAISPRCCARRCARCWPTTTSTSPTGTTPATCSLDRRTVRLRRICRPCHRLSEHLGPGAHVVAVCQPCVQALVAAAVMAEDDDPAQPAAMTLMAGPIDTRISPTKVNELAKDKPIEWFETQPDRPRALALQGRAPARLSGLHPAFRLHGDEPEPASEGACRAVPAISPAAHAEKADPDQGVLRRIFRGARSAGRILSGNRAMGVPGAPVAAGRR